MNGVTIDGKHSYSDYGMLLQPKSIPLPKPKITTVSVEGADGEIDLSTSLTNGNMRFENRLIKLKFAYISVDEIDEKISEFYSAIHGRTLDFIFDDDPEHYYTGRWSVTDVANNNGYTVLEVEISADPYRYDVETTVVSKTIDGTHSVILGNGRKWVIPDITADAEMVLQFEGVLYKVLEGRHTNNNVILRDGDNILTFSGTGTVIIEYRQGVL